MMGISTNLLATPQTEDCKGGRTASNNERQEGKRGDGQSVIGTGDTVPRNSI